MTRLVILAAAIVGLLVAVTRGGEAKATDGEATEMWFVDVGSDQAMFIGSMASQQICEKAAAALARDRHAHGVETMLAVFDCQPRRVEQH